MTGKQPIWFGVIAAASAAALLAAHLVMPINAGWSVNHYLHYGWQGLVVLAGAGGVVWLMWPRPKARRRDEDRAAARRRVIGVAVAILAAVFLIIIGELHREYKSRGLLEKESFQDLQAVGKALAAYTADHAGARPKSIEELAPKYLDPACLYYVYRNGPAATEKKAEAAPEGKAPPPSYALVQEVPGTQGVKKLPTAVVAYLRPGQAWAPLTAVLDENGQCRIVSEDNVRSFERQFETK